MSPDLELTVQQAARELGVGERTVRKWCKEGRLVARKGRGQFGPRWLISADDIGKKRVAHSAEREEQTLESEGGTGAALQFRAILDEMRRMQEEVASYREQLERLTVVVERLLPPARTEKRWWQFWRVRRSQRK